MTNYMKFDRVITDEIIDKRDYEQMNEQRKSSVRLELEESNNNTFLQEIL
jgi:hypothetical protein